MENQTWQKVREDLQKKLTKKLRGGNKVFKKRKKSKFEGK